MKKNRNLTLNILCNERDGQLSPTRLKNEIIRVISVYNPAHCEQKRPVYHS